MLKCYLSLVFILNSALAASASCNIETRIDDGRSCESIDSGPSIRLAGKGHSSKYYNSHSFVIDANGGPAKVVRKHDQRPRAVGPSFGPR
jgi:hypothetical protein